MISLDRPQWYDEDGQLRSSFSASEGLPVIETTISDPDDLPRDKSAIYYNPSGWTLATPGMGPGTSTTKYITVLYSGVQYSYDNSDLVVQKAVVGHQAVGLCYEVQRRRTSSSVEFGPWETVVSCAPTSSRPTIPYFVASGMGTTEFATAGSEVNSGSPSQPISGKALTEYVSSSIASAKDLLYEGPVVTVSTNTPAVGNAYSFPLTNFNRSPVVGDKFPALVKSSTSDKLFSVICQVGNVSTSTVNATYTSVLQIASDYTNEILLRSGVSSAESIGQLSSQSGLYFGSASGGSQCHAMIGTPVVGGPGNIYGGINPLGEVFAKTVTVSGYLNRQLLYYGTGPYIIDSGSIQWVHSGDDVGASGLFVANGNFSETLTVSDNEGNTLTCNCCIIYGTLGGYQYALGFRDGASNNYTTERFFGTTLTIRRGGASSLSIYSL